MLVSISHCNYYIPLYHHYILIIYILISSLYPHYWFLSPILSHFLLWLPNSPHPPAHYQAVRTRPHLGLQVTDGCLIHDQAGRQQFRQRSACSWRQAERHQVERGRKNVENRGGMKPWLTVKPWGYGSKQIKNPGEHQNCWDSWMPLPFKMVSLGIDPSPWAK